MDRHPAVAEAGRGSGLSGRIRLCPLRGSPLEGEGRRATPLPHQGPPFGKTRALSRGKPSGGGPVRRSSQGSPPAAFFDRSSRVSDLSSSCHPLGMLLGNGQEREGRLPGPSRPDPPAVSCLSRCPPFGHKPQPFGSAAPDHPGGHPAGLSGACLGRRRLSSGISGFSHRRSLDFRAARPSGILAAICLSGERPVIGSALHCRFFGEKGDECER